MTARSQGQEGGDALRKYLESVGTYSLLTADDEVSLAQAIEQGQVAVSTLDASTNLTKADRARSQRAIRAGEQARQAFINANLRLVVSIAKRYTKSPLPMLDLIQEGNLGLIKAVEKFDYRKGFKFSTYATWWIRQSITRAIADKGRTIRVPVHMIDTIALVRYTEQSLAKGRPHKPTDAEIAAAAGIPVGKVTESRKYASEPVSIFEPIGEDDAVLGDFIEDATASASFDAVAAELQKADLQKFLNRLNDRERTVLEMRFGLVSDQPRTLDQVGQHFDLTRERVRQIEAKALAKLRHPSSPANLRHLLA